VFSAGDRALVKFVDFAYGGEGVGRVDNFVVFAPYTAPGDEAEVEIVEAKKRFARGRLVRVVNPSPLRVEPQCSLFGRCGGCTMQHIAYEEQLKIKHKMVLDSLRRIGHFQSPPLKEVRPSLKRFGYRSRARLHIRGGLVGFLALRSHELVPVEECPLLEPQLNEALPEVREIARRVPGLSQVLLRARREEGAGAMCVLFGRASKEETERALSGLELNRVQDIVWVDPDSGQVWALRGEESAFEFVAETPLRCTAHAFFQVNPSVTEVLVRLVQRAVGDPKGKVIWDLYAGVGTFALTVAKNPKKAVAVEADPLAYGDAAWNTREGLRRPWVEVIHGAVEEVVPRLPPRPDVAILDPPRGGCSKEALRAILRAKPKALVYVSCDPPTFARDAAEICKRGYRLEWVEPLDMFPQTHHLELVAKFSMRVELVEGPPPKPPRFRRKGKA